MQFLCLLHLLNFVFDGVQCPRSMQSRVYVTVGCPSSVRPSVCAIDRQQQRRPVGLLLSDLRRLRAGDIDR